MQREDGFQHMVLHRVGIIHLDQLHVRTCKMGCLMGPSMVHSWQYADVGYTY